MVPLSARDVVDILMESAFYFDLDLSERRSLIKHIIEISSCDLPPEESLLHWV